MWRLDSGRKYLSEISEQRGKSVVGVTGHHKPLSYKGRDKVLDYVNMGDVTNNLTSVPKILDKGGSMYGNSEGCIIWDKNNKIIIRGYRGDKNMYQYNLGESKVELMQGQVIDDKGVVYEKMLSGD